MSDASDNAAYFPDDLPDFAPGQVVRHRRYDYRGVVVDFDMSCAAGDEWYHRNRSQPDRDQPWYHVLVDGSDVITYAAQTSLEADGEPEPIAHPLIEYFFGAFDAGRYDRNDRNWPGWPEGQGAK